MRWQRLTARITAAGILVAPFLFFSSITHPAVAYASCHSSTNRYYYAERYNSQSADGEQASLSVSTLTPYNCDDTVSHTVESTALFLPLHDSSGNYDVVENGLLRGTAGSAHGSCTCPNEFYYFQYAGEASAGTSYLNVDQATTGLGHTYSVQEFVRGCPSACQLYSHFVTDSTAWSDINLPANDNPGWEEVINGEVTYDPNTQMGDGVWTLPNVHAGTWQAWGGTLSSLTQNPYCNYDESSNGVFKYENTGPITGGQQC